MATRDAHHRRDGVLLGTTAALLLVVLLTRGSRRFVVGKRLARFSGCLLLLLRCTGCRCHQSRLLKCYRVYFYDHRLLGLVMNGFVLLERTKVASAADSSAGWAKGLLLGHHRDGNIFSQGVESLKRINKIWNCN